ncbi:sulfatase family protein [Hufsiella ginkgonis]|uniref:Sulfatase-like hydrolase/transferase n=1 Tax=Hufsiella ginkgonis TaxID=2695274 RepID=A0A7K1XWS0_9SPHI|nr:sulfatase [Hufsiella ginkgonis]MXV15431.1 sulfatase-like hydrolase/transferase [Hufsiella ginkgonis]
MDIHKCNFFATRFVVVSALLSQLISCNAKKTVTAPERRPNIVFIMSDDHAYQAISAYDTSLVRTPNIDRIAREGVLFEEACVTNSVCSPSRAVILTGKYSHVNGLRDNGTFFDGAQETFPKILRQNGYRTAMIGKWHLWSTPTGFDYWNVLPDQGHYYAPSFIRMGKDTTYQGYVTDIITDLGIDWISRNRDAPFCLMLQHKAPHRNFMPPIKYLDTLNKRKYPLPANFYDNYEGRQALQRQHITVKEDLDIRYDSKIPCDSCPVNPINNWAPAEYERELKGLTPAQRKAWDAAYAIEYAKFRQLKTNDGVVRFQFQRYMEDYLRCVVSVDDNVGRLLKYLDDNGLADNTIVVYLSDQGFYLGEHGLYDKRFMYNESFRTPMMIRYPNGIKKGKRLRDYVLNLDIAPTLLDLAGIKVPLAMQGASMKTLLRSGTDKNWRKEVYYHYYERSFGLTPHFGIRTSRYKLIHFYEFMDSWELYDLKKDPTEMHNLYGEPAYRHTVIQLKGKLAALQKRYGDKPQ